MSIVLPNISRAFNVEFESQVDVTYIGELSNSMASFFSSLPGSLIPGRNVMSVRHNEETYILERFRVHQNFLN